MSDYEYRPDDNYGRSSGNGSQDPSGYDGYGNMIHYDRNQGRNQRYNYIPEEPVRTYGPERKKSFFASAAKIAGLALVFGLVSGAAFAGVNTAKNHFFPSPRIETTTPAEDEDKGSGTSTVTASDPSQITTADDISGVVEQVMPSVVSITGTFRTNDYFGFGSQESQGAGSGFIIAEDDNRLLIATNNHVVANSTSLTVGFVDGTNADATVVGKDSNADLAVISVNKKDISQETSKKIKKAVLGDSDSIKVGQPVIAIGNALGYGQSVTTGVLSAKDREVSFTDGSMNLLQTDAAINPGNSGGVLINLKGEVIGINNAKLADTTVEGMGYAIPITTANSVLNDLMNAGEITEKDASYLGIVGKNIDSNYSAALGMPQGVYVAQIVSGSPAEKAGLSAGDIITALDGNKVSTMNGLKEKLAIKKAGTKVKVTYKRVEQNGEYKEKTINVTLGKASDFKDAVPQQEESQNQPGFQDNGQGNGQGDEGFGFDDGQNGSPFGEEEEIDPFEYFFNR